MPEGEIPNPKHEIPKEGQKSNVRNRNDNSKRKISSLYAVILHLCHEIKKNFTTDRSHAAKPLIQVGNLCKAKPD
jgi:hypothetical protein